MGNVNLCGGPKSGQSSNEIKIGQGETIIGGATESPVENDELGTKARAGRVSEVNNKELQRELEQHISELGEKLPEEEMKEKIPERIAELLLEFPLKTDEDLIEYKVSDKLAKLSPIRLPNGDEYNGQWSKEKKPEGVGYMIRPDGTHMEGIWKEGKFVKGRISYPNDSIYIGALKDGQIREDENGLLFENDWKYEGAFVNGVREGKSKMSYTDGTIVEGEFKDNKPVKAKFTWPDGYSYDGDVTSFTLGPEGTFTNANGNTYEGSWSERKFDGKGIFTWRNANNKFEGDYKKGRKEGKGVYYFNYPNVFYQGNWLHDKPHGQGELVMKDKIIKGLWRYGKLVQILIESIKPNEVEIKAEAEMNPEAELKKEELNPEAEIIVEAKPEAEIQIKEEKFDPYNLVILKEDIDTKSLPHLCAPEHINASSTYKFRPVSGNELFSIAMQQQMEEIIHNGKENFNQVIVNKEEHNELKVEEPKTIEKVEEPIEEPKAEEPNAEEKKEAIEKVEETKAEETKPEEKKEAIVIAEEPKTEEPKPEEENVIKKARAGLRPNADATNYNQTIDIPKDIIIEDNLNSEEPKNEVEKKAEISVEQGQKEIENKVECDPQGQTIPDPNLIENASQVIEIPTKPLEQDQKVEKNRRTEDAIDILKDAEMIVEPVKEQ